MRRLLLLLGVAGIGLVIVIWSVVAPFAQIAGIGPGQIVRVMLTSGSGRSIGVPAYLLSKNITTASTTVVKASPGVLACVNVNKAGAAGSTAKLYDHPTSALGVVLGTLDTATSGVELCYGLIFPDGLVIVTASGGALADLTVTYR